MMDAKAGAEVIEEAAAVLPGDVVVTANINIVYHVR
jgi:hypothetical protein